MPTMLEIVHWPANEAFLKDNAILKPTGDAMAPCAGLQKSAMVRRPYYGQQVDATHAYIAIAWDSLAAHMAPVADAPNIVQGTAVVSSTFAEGAAREMLHAQFADTGAPFAALGAPVTEFAVVTPKAGRDVKNILARLAAFLNEAGSPTFGAVVAPVIVGEGSYLLVVGWNDLKDKWANLPQVIVELLGNAEVNLSCVKLLQHGSV